MIFKGELAAYEVHVSFPSASVVICYFTHSPFLFPLLHLRKKTLNDPQGLTFCYIHFMLQERFNKLIYGINKIIKCGT